MLIWARTVTAFSNEPDGFGPLRFGGPPSEAQRAFPNLKDKGAEQFLAFYEIENQTVFGLKPCNLELSFVDGQLYRIQFTCRSSPAKVAATLEKRFGEPTQRKPDATLWLGEQRTIGLNPASGVFAFTDRVRGQVANQKLMRYIAESQARATVNPAAPTPAAGVPPQQ